MKRRIFKSILTGATALLMSVTLVGCDSDISVVQDGSPYDYPDKTWGEVLDETCKKGEWESFTGENDETIVEYNGVVKETAGFAGYKVGSKKHYCSLCDGPEFGVDDEEFEIVYMDVDGESCDMYEIVEIVEVLFE